MAGHHDESEKRVTLAREVEQGVDHNLCQNRAFQEYDGGLAVEPVLEANEDALPAEGVPLIEREVFGLGRWCNSSR